MTDSKYRKDITGFECRKKINNVDSLIEYIKYRLKEKNISIYSFGVKVFKNKQLGYYYLNPTNFESMNFTKLRAIFDYLKMDYAVLDRVYKKK